MHVHVDRFRRHGDVDGQHGMAVLRQVVRIGAPDGAEQLPVPNRAPVHRHELVLRVAAIERRHRSMARQPRPFPLALDRERVRGEVLPQGIAQAPQERVVAVAPVPHTMALAVLEHEAHPRIGDRRAQDDIGDGPRLGPIGLHELQARGHGVEQVGHLDQRARLRGGGPRGLRAPAVDGDAPAVTVRRARGDGQPRHRADGGQRFAAKAQRFDPLEIAGGQLGRAMPFHRERQVVRPHPPAVVAHAHQALAASLDHDLDGARASIERVVHELAHHGSRPVHHLAGGDAVDQRFLQASDGCGHARTPCASHIVANPPHGSGVAPSTAPRPQPGRVIGGRRFGERG